MPSNSKVLRFQCKKCGKCCSDPQTFVNLTYIDIFRISKALDTADVPELLRYIGFYTFEEEQRAILEEQMIFTPLETEKGSAFIGILRDDKGACIFLDPDNTCSIYEHRPMICRMFPFTTDKNAIRNSKNNDLSKSIKIIYSKKGVEYCPGITKSSPLVKKRKLESFISKYLTEIAMDSLYVNSFNNLIKDGRIKNARAADYIRAIMNAMNREEVLKKFGK